MMNESVVDRKKEVPCICLSESLDSFVNKTGVRQSARGIKREEPLIKQPGPKFIEC